MRLQSKPVKVSREPDQTIGPFLQLFIYKGYAVAEGLPEAKARNTGNQATLAHLWLFMWGH